MNQSKLDTLEWLSKYDIQIIWVLAITYFIFSDQ